MNNNRKYNVKGNCNIKNIVKGQKYRFTLITEQLIRLEYDENGIFEDEATSVFINRDLGEVDYKVLYDGDELIIETKFLRLSYNTKLKFNKNSLYIEVKGAFSTYGSVWNYGESFRNLLGTTKTLDAIDGETSLENGLLSKDGYTYFDDSNSVIIEKSGNIRKRERGLIDGYFFGYGREYLKCLKDFFRISGETPLIPRYALGNWWSRYWAYSEESYMELLNKFKNKKIPFSVCVMDMDWHITDVPQKYGTGWTGYSWNKKLFPDYKRFLSWLKNENYKITLNLHPASGIRAFEDCYEEVAKFVGVNYEEEQPVNFDFTNQKFIDAYFRLVHNPLEEDGVDFWWIDWQQGTTSKLEGVDPLWLLNHYHIQDMSFRGKESLILSRYAGVGSHRYPVGFSGDTFMSWDSLKFQPYFTSTASNVGYCWWSHDIGGHMLGTRSSELMIRWLQFGVFSPINRLHSSNSLFNAKEPWSYEEDAEKIITKYLKLRHSLIPYIYTMNYKLAKDGLPLISPMYYYNPYIEDAYNVKGQYYFGTQLLVAPITNKIDNITKLAKQKIWLPDGVWYDYFTGKKYDGNCYINMYRDLKTQLVLAKAGAIIPLNLNEETNCVNNPEKLNILMFSGSDNEFELIESVNNDYNIAITKIENKLYTCNEIIINKVSGDVKAIPKNREITISLRGVENCKEIEIYTQGKSKKVLTTYDEISKTLSFNILNYNLHNEYKINCSGVVQLKKQIDFDKIFDVLLKSEIENVLKEKVYNIIKSNEEKAKCLVQLNTLNLPNDLFSILCELVL